MMCRLTRLEWVINYFQNGWKPTSGYHQSWHKLAGNLSQCGWSITRLRDGPHLDKNSFYNYTVHKKKEEEEEEKEDRDGYVRRRDRHHHQNKEGGDKYEIEYYEVNKATEVVNRYFDTTFEFNAKMNR